MTVFYLASWLYCSIEESEKQAREFFEKLRLGLENGIEYPFKVPYEIALIHANGGSERWMVGVLGGLQGDLETGKILDKWLEQCGAGEHETLEYPTVRGGSIRSTFAESVGTYEFVDEIVS